jgi:hypothetical protein
MDPLSDFREIRLIFSKLYSSPLRLETLERVT